MIIRSPQAVEKAIFSQTRSWANKNKILSAGLPGVERIAYSVVYRLNKYWEDNPIKEFTLP